MTPMAGRPSEIRIASKLRRGEMASEEFSRLFDRQPLGWLLWAGESAYPTAGDRSGRAGGKEGVVARMRHHLEPGARNQLSGDLGVRGQRRHRVGVARYDPGWPGALCQLGVIFCRDALSQLTAAYPPIAAVQSRRW